MIKQNKKMIIKKENIQEAAYEKKKILLPRSGNY